MAQKMKDYRPEDIELLSERGLHATWVHFWENELFTEIHEIEDTNQRDWHNSRLSLLKGHEIALSECESKIGVIKEWVETYLMPRSSSTCATITLFRSEGEELKNILGIES